MKNTSSIKRIVSVTEAKSYFGSILKWVTEKNRDVVIQVYGKSKAVVMSYRDYRVAQKLRERERQRKSGEELEALRRKVSARFANIPEDERYRMADMSESVIREVIEQDAKLPRDPE